MEDASLPGVFRYVCGADENLVKDHTQKINFLVETFGSIGDKLEAVLEAVKYVEYRNGDDGNTLTRVATEDFHQSLWNAKKSFVTKDTFEVITEELKDELKAINEKISAKHIFNAAGSFSRNAISIMNLLLILGLIYFSIVKGGKDASEFAGSKNRQEQIIKGEK